MFHIWRYFSDIFVIAKSYIFSIVLYCMFSDHVKRTEIIHLKTKMNPSEFQANTLFTLNSDTVFIVYIHVFTFMVSPFFQIYLSVKGLYLHFFLYVSIFLHTILLRYGSYQDYVLYSLLLSHERNCFILGEKNDTSSREGTIRHPLV